MPNRINAFVVTCAVVLLGLAAPSFSVAGLPVVGIVLEIKDPMYETYYSSTDYQQFREGVLNLLSDKFSREIGFLKFAINSQEPVTLKIRIDKADQNAGLDFREIGFFFRLTGNNLRRDRKAEPVYLQLRPGEDYGDVDEVQNELERIRLALVSLDSEELVSRLLHRVPIAKRAKYLDEPVVGWAIPYRKREICIDQDSQIEVTLRLTYQGFSKPIEKTYVATTQQELSESSDWGEWGGMMFGLAAEPEAIKKVMNSNPGANNVAVGEVYIKEYIRLQKCGESDPVNVSF